MGNNSKATMQKKIIIITRNKSNIYKNNSNNFKDEQNHRFEKKETLI